MAPLIITLMIDATSQQFFSAQRELYFPKHVNYLQSHITLFHKLPADANIIDDTLKTLAKTKPFIMQVTEVKNIGNGTAYFIVSPTLSNMHLQMQQAFDPYLVGKDRQKLWPHITVQNKVTANKARLLQKNLRVHFVPLTITAIGFSTWFYLGGPWEKKEEFMFTGQ